MLDEIASHPGDPFAKLAREYVDLVLAVGEHDDGYVDAYYGPESWRERVRAEPAALSEIARRARDLRQRIADTDRPTTGEDAEMWALRAAFLDAQSSSIAAYAEILAGHPLAFDDESRALYDTEAPHYDPDHYRNLIAQLEPLLPGDGDIETRYHAFQAEFVIPRDRLASVFEAAIAASRQRTLEHVTLPANEDFRLEYVTDKVWSGYNLFEGRAQSLIQINTDLPIYIDRAVDLAAHEGYPGHHVYNALLESRLARARGWVEFCVYPLFSPQSVIAEGTANYGIEVAFPWPDRIAFEAEELFPRAGLDPSRAATYYDVMRLVQQLNYANNDVAREYLAGTIDRDEAIARLRASLLYEPARAAQRLGFIEAHRAYVLTYNWGQDLVKRYVEQRVGRHATDRERWDTFVELLTSPRRPQQLM
ncbi:MAG: hypothetical protein B7733_10370 [Myxococcales bacterium FL481]|nr:MAG: hypothetical protein B7733_10370 [Myxococcales bacterium FL481]